MKRRLIVTCLFALLLAAVVGADTSEYYPVRLNVVKIYAHADGYCVVYRKGLAGTANAYLPSKWFTAGGKAEIIRGTDPSYPYMVVFFKEGKPDHVKLYALASNTDITWGILDPSQAKDKFNGDDIKIEF